MALIIVGMLGIIEGSCWVLVMVLGLVRGLGVWSLGPRV